VHLETDCFWHFIATGYIEPWKPESQEQNTLVMEIIAEVARRYAKAGYFTVIDGIVGPRSFFEPLRAVLIASELRVCYAILRPPLPVAVERATLRRSTRLADRAVIEHLWRGFVDLEPSLEANVVIENGDLSAEGTLAVVLERLHAGRLAV
jgi:hypothetical protein